MPSDTTEYTVILPHRKVCRESKRVYGAASAMLLKTPKAVAAFHGNRREIYLSAVQDLEANGVYPVVLGFHRDEALAMKECRSWSKWVSNYSLSWDDVDFTAIPLVDGKGTYPAAVAPAVAAVAAVASAAVAVAPVVGSQLPLFG